MPSAADSAGEILTLAAVHSSTTHQPAPKPKPKPTTSDDEIKSSSPPMQPAFFSQALSTTGDVAPGKENACLNPMAAPFSPQLSPLVELMARETLQKKKGDGSGILAKFIDECAGNGDGISGSEREVLGVVDTNVLVAQPDETTGKDYINAVDSNANGAASKKSKKKSKKTNATNSSTAEQATSQPTSYSEAAKSDAVTDEKREAGDVKDKSPNKNPIATPAGGKSFADVVKDSKSHASNEKGKGSAVNDNMSQASTTVGYPELHSESSDDEERRKDEEKATRVARVRWAPLRVPFRRRLQTLAVLFHSLCMGISLSLFFTACAVPLTWPVVIIYLFFVLFSTDAFDGRLRKRKEWVRRLPIWNYFAEYYPAKLHKTHDLMPTRKYIFGYHPHGIISHGAWAAFATEGLGFAQKFPGITNSLLTLDSNFRLPLYREYIFAMGVLSVSKESIVNILTRGGRNNEGMGRAVTIVVGGARESLEAQPKTMRLIIKERKGFIKLAIQTGADLVPVVAFGENDLYDQLDPHAHPWLHGMQRHFLKVWKFTVPLLHGRGIFNYDVGLMPYRRPLNIVVGKPIKVMQAANPDNSEVNRLHDLYTEELQKIWDTYKEDFAPDRKEEMQFLD